LNIEQLLGLHSQWCPTAIVFTMLSDMGPLHEVKDAVQIV
jgi:hypothetical protein